jgi:alkylated DNA repair dioxygenase AlkB
MNSSPVTYTPDLMPDADAAFERLWNELDWVQYPDAPRREYWSNDENRPYTYGRGMGRRTYEAQPFHPLVIMARDLLNDRIGVYFEACFLNGYGTKRDWLGWHADDDPSIDHSKPIAVISLYGPGARARSIQFREADGVSENGKTVFKPLVDQPLAQGSLFLMHAGMQATHEHRIPKASFEAEPRISLTFRSLLTA